MNRRTRLVAGLALVLVAAAALFASPRAVLARLAWFAADPVRFAAALALLALVRPLFAWPTTLLAVVAGYGYGVPGFAPALSLIVVSSLPPYAFARRFGGDGPVASTGGRFVDAAGNLRSVVASRLLPIPSDIVSVAAGAAGVPLRAFALGTALGEVPWAVAGVVAGRSAERALTVGLGAVVDLRLVLAATLAAVLVLGGPAYRAYRRRRGLPESELL